MNEYDPFNENPIENNTPAEEAAAGNENEALHSADAVWGAETARPAEPEPDFREQPSDREASYQNSHYNYAGPAFTARPAGGAYTGRRNEPSDSYTVQAQTKQEKRRSGFWKKAVALALVCALLGGGAGFGGALLANRMNKSGAESGKDATNVQVAAPRESTELNVITVDSGKLMNAAQVYAANVNSTVGITTEITTTNWWG